jgi:hypothetical protein
MLIRFCLSALAATASMGGAAIDTVLVDTRPETRQGMLAVRLTGARLVFVTVQAVNLFVARIEGRRASSDSGPERDHNEWVTLAEPNAVLDIMALHDGATALLGITSVDTGRYTAFRIVVDLSQSTLALKDGRTLPMRGDSPVAGHRVIDAEVRNEVDVKANAVTSITFEMRVGDTFSLRGTSSVREGLTFNPSATVESTREKLSLFGEPRLASRRYLGSPLR